MFQHRCIKLKFYFFLYIFSQIKKESGKEIVRIAKYLNEDDLGIYILKEVINMAHDELNEENKIVAV